MNTKPTGGKHPTILKDKATGNHALDAYAYVRWPHLFNVLALKYDVPPSLLLTLLFLWDRTVGTGNDFGDVALSQIPVRRQEKVKWLAAFVAANFFERQKSKSGGRTQEGSFYVYNNPSADEWDEFFRRSEFLRRFPKWDAVSAESFARLSADVRDGRKGSAAATFALFDQLTGGMKA